MCEHTNKHTRIHNIWTHAHDVVFVASATATLSKLKSRKNSMIGLLEVRLDLEEGVAKKIAQTLFYETKKKKVNNNNNTGAIRHLGGVAENAN